MSIKVKLVAIYVFSIVTSVLVFMVSTYYLLNSGYYSGITEADMNAVAKGIQERLVEEVPGSLEDVEEKNVLTRILKENKQEHPKMSFELYVDEHTVYTTEDKPFLENHSEIVECLSKKGTYAKKHLVTATVTQLDGQDIYILVGISKEDAATITYAFNGYRSKGVLGKITLLGLEITILVLGTLIYIFMRRITERFKKLYKGFEEFELGNVAVRIHDEKKDEIGELARNFDAMADKIEEQLREKLQYEENRKQLISNLSHDLRTPLSSILGYSEMLRDGVCEEKEEEKRYMNTIYRKAVYMNQLLGDLLDFSRLDIGRMELHKGRCDLSEVLRELVIEYWPTIEKEHINLGINIPEKPIQGEWDRERIERAIRNVIDNALKYGMQGKRLVISLANVLGKARIEIEDFGVGMDEVTKAHIFERFYRGDCSRNTKSGGMGLGLAITKEIVEKHNGTITVESEKGIGTSIIIILPL